MKRFLCLRAVALGALLSVIAQIACADSWRYPATITSKAETHGDVEIRRIVDARKNQQYPSFSVEVSRGKVLLARVPGVYFQKLFVAPDNSLFVGLSNDGLPGTAVVIFDNNGALRLEAKHDTAQFEYCEQSVTRQRVWFDAEKPEVSFKKDPQWGGYTVTVRNCRGKDVNLIAEIKSAYNRSFQRTTSGSR